MSTAIAVMQKGRTNLKDFGEPQINLSHVHGRLVWIVAFFQLGGPPGAFYDVGIDDQTGATEIGGGR
ncbi:MAG TPA: hypothetical protein VGM64_19455 [Lacunisphaera sp.]|jgi:hypothetical protein